MRDMAPEPRSRSSAPLSMNGAAAQGGAAAILGFLYQVLGTSARLLEATIAEAAGGEPPHTVTAILEPSSGGDLEIGGTKRACTQFKHRSRPLGAGELVDEVLADLFRAHCVRPCDSYELQCSTRLTKPALRLMERLGGSVDQHPGTEDSLLKLRTLCATIFEQRAKRNAREFDHEFGAFATRVRVGAPLDCDTLRSSLHRLLQARLPYLDRIDSKLDEMIGNLVRRSATNDAPLAGNELLGILGMQATPPGEPARRLRAALDRVLAARRFNVEEDVRDARLPSDEHPLTIITGASGCGKTWTLCRLAHELAERGQAALLISAPDIHRLHEQMVRAVAVDALDHESPIEPASLGRLWRRSLGSSDATLWILWEGCRDLNELVSVHFHDGLGTGLRLVAEVPPATAISESPLKDVPARQVGEFTEGELFDALKRRGIPAGRVPEPIRRMLRVPILCGIYASLAAELPDWNPTNEYLVLERFWERAGNRTGPLASACLKTIARRMIERRRARLSDGDVAGLGLADEMLGKLVGVGWLERIDEHWRFAHERLLTWAIAEALAERFADESLEPAELADIQAELGRSHDDKARMQELGFLLMDLVWLVMRRGASEDRIAALLAALEDERETGQRTLYRELLPTAGPRIVPFVIARLRMIDGEPPAGLSGDIAAALRALPQYGADRTTIAASLAASEAPITRTVLVLLGAEWPLVEHLDSLWAEYVALHRDVDSAELDFERSQLLEQALRCATAAAPDWLRRAIENADDPESLWLGLHLLKSLPAFHGRPIWTAMSGKLIAVLGSSRRAGLAECIGRFGDRANVGLLHSVLVENGYASGFALEALTRIDPGNALSLVEQLNPAADLPHGRVWLDRLLDADPKGANCICNWMLARDPSGMQLARLWLRAIDRIDAETLTKLLGLLDSHAQKRLCDGRASGALFHCLGHLHLSPEHDGEFALWRDSALARRLRKRAMEPPRPGGDDEVIAVRRLLRRIGGPEYEALLLDWLDRPVSQCLNGIRWAPLAPCPAIQARLESLAEDWDSPCEDEVRIELWRTLWGMDPERWVPRVLELLAASEDERIHLGLFLIREGGTHDMFPKVLACLERSEPGSRTEALALNLAIQLGEAPLLFDRGRSRFQQENDTEEGRIGAFNVMLKDRRPESRSMLDEFLLKATAQKSISSTVLEMLSLRLGQPDVSERLFAAGERYMRRRAFFGEDIVDAYLDRTPDIAREYLLERAFTIPDILVSAQPDAIRSLAKVDQSLAEEAFIQSWREHPGRRRYLAPVARELSDEVLAVLVEGLADDRDGRAGKLAFRAACLELRRRHETAQSLILTALQSASPATRLALCDALAWMPEPCETLRHAEANDPEPEVRERAYEVRLEFERKRAAIEAFRARPDSLEAMEFVLDLVDPRIVTNFEDDWGVVPTIQQNSRLMLFAEAQLARRYNEVSDSHIKRVRLRPHQRQGGCLRR